MCVLLFCQEIEFVVSFSFQLQNEWMVALRYTVLRQLQQIPLLLNICANVPLIYLNTIMTSNAERKTNIPQIIEYPDMLYMSCFMLL